MKFVVAYIVTAVVFLRPDALAVAGGARHTTGNRRHAARAARACRWRASTRSSCSASLSSPARSRRWRAGMAGRARHAGLGRPGSSSPYVRHHQPLSTLKNWSLTVTLTDTSPETRHSLPSPPRRAPSRRQRIKPLLARRRLRPFSRCQRGLRLHVRAWFSGRAGGQRFSFRISLGQQSPGRWQSAVAFPANGAGATSASTDSIRAAASSPATAGGGGAHSSASRAVRTHPDLISPAASRWCLWNGMDAMDLSVEWNNGSAAGWIWLTGLTRDQPWTGLAPAGLRPGRTMDWSGPFREWNGWNGR